VRRIVVVGASLAGVTAADHLRELGYDGALELIGDEPVAPYDRPPLSKGMLSGDPLEQILLRSAGHFEAHNITLRLGKRATGLDLAARRINLDGGEQVDYDGLILATGARPRRPDFPLPKDGVAFLRSIGDALALRQTLQSRPKLVIVGAGFIGMEVATFARSAGIDVTVVEPQPYPMFRALGPVFGIRLRSMLEESGVAARFGCGVVTLLGTRRLRGVGLSDGGEIAADLVLMAVGSVPNVEWLAESGLGLENGVACDGFGAVAERVFAVGDVASRFDPALGRHVRSEHWTSAVEEAAAAAHNLLKPRAEWRRPSAVPYVWSDQLGGKLQIAGNRPAQAVEHMIEPDDNRFLACYQAAGKIGAIATFNWPALMARGRQLLAQGADWETALGILTDASKPRRKSA
jgi:NADPH-dependent 2,4-dienoyl-CoA reductase/sulfur reductase-like enzyme